MSSISLSNEQRNTLDIGRHLVVRANAGSGKTFVLTLRIVWLIGEHGVPIENIVAITFTNKAAAEMRSRVQSLMEQLLSDAELVDSLGFTIPPGVLADRMKNALLALSKARIMTFHSFASSLVRKHGFDVGVSPDSRDVQEREQKQMLHDSMRKAVRSAVASGTIRILHEHLGIEQTENHLLALISSGENLDRVLDWYPGASHVTNKRQEALPHGIVESVISSGRRTFDELHRLAADSNKEGSNYLTELNRLLELLSRTETVTTTNVILLIAHIQTLYTKAGTGRKNSSVAKDSELLSPLTSTFKKAIQWAECSAADEELQSQVLDAMLQIAKDAEQQYSELKRKKQVLDFDDMMRIAVRLLREKPNIAKAIQNSIRYLMVDEFQDSNPLQYELISLLVRDLDGRSPRNTELFVVGDDKQSIYGFRNADVRLFRTIDNAVQMANVAAGIHKESSLLLENSYRMTPALAAQVNAVCSLSFSQESEFDVAYTPLVSKRTTTSEEQIGSLHLRVVDEDNVVVPEDDNEAEQDVPATEIDAIVHQVTALLDGTDRAPLERSANDERLSSTPVPSDIAILVRDRNTVSAVARRLHSESIPVQVHGGRSFYSRPEIADVRNLLLALHKHDNALALTSVLRSPIFQCTDADIFTLASLTEFSKPCWEGVESVVRKQHPSAALRGACSTLVQLHSMLPTNTIADLIRYTLSHTMWYATLSGDPRRQLALGNIAKLLDIISEVEQVPGSSLHDIIEAITIPEGTDNEAEHSLEQATVGVQVMTIHSAKGLEFPIVILAGISNRAPSSATASSDELGPTFKLSGCHPTQSHDANPIPVDSGPAHYANKIIEVLKDQAEVKRLLYVALTRAEFHIRIIVRTKTNKQGDVTCSNPLGTLVINARHVVSNVQLYTSSRSTLQTTHSIVPTIQRLEVLDGSTRLAVFSITDLVSDEMVVGASDTANARMQGIEVHAAIANLLSYSRDATHHPNPIVNNFLAAKTAWSSVPIDAYVEAEFVSLVDDCVVIGRPDLVFIDPLGKAHIWDWKVVSPASTDEQQEQLMHYLPQLAGYAWLVMKTNPTIHIVHARLLFVPLANASIETWSVEKVFMRKDVDYIEEEIRSRTATPAA